MIRVDEIPGLSKPFDAPPPDGWQWVGDWEFFGVIFSWARARRKIV